MGQTINYFYNSYKIPYETTLSLPISYGSQVHIYGIPQGDRFEINLVNHRGDILLHVNPRLLDHQVVLNTEFEGNWGREERHAVDLKRSQLVGVIILITEEGFKVAINNQHIATFRHRLLPNATEMVSIKGDVKLEHIQIYPHHSSR